MWTLAISNILQFYPGQNRTFSDIFAHFYVESLYSNIFHFYQSYSPKWGFISSTSILILDILSCISIGLLRVIGLNAVKRTAGFLILLNSLDCLFLTVTFDFKFEKVDVSYLIFQSKGSSYIPKISKSFHY